MANLDALKQNEAEYLKQGIEIKKSYCDICNQSSHCTIDAYIKDGKIIKMEGAQDSPHTFGMLCPQGAANRQYIYSDERLLYPMKNVGKKGEGKFERITWEEAYSTIAEKLGKCKEEHGAESVAFMTGFEKWFRPTLSRFAAKFGSSNYFTEGSTCQEAHVMTWKLLTGECPGADFRNTNLLMVWSRNPMYSNFSYNRPLFDAIENGLEVITVDSRVTPLAQRSKIHLMPRPGTDGALALGMANVIISENLYDKEFIEKYAYGFEEFAELAKEYTPEKVKELTGVDGDLMVKAARMYAKAKPAAMQMSASPIVHHVNGVQNYRSVASLVALCGYYDIKGGNTTNPFTYLHVGSYIPSNEDEYKSPRVKEPLSIGYDRFPIWKELIVDQGQAMALPDAMLNGDPYPIKAAYFAGVNHMMWPDTDYVLKAFQSLDFMVAVDLFMTETCKSADIVLPALSSFEREDVKIFSDSYLQCLDPVIEPMGECRNDIEIMHELVKRLKIDDPLLNMSYAEYMDYMIAPTGITVADIKKNGGMLKCTTNFGSYKERKYETEGFNTRTGKVEFKSKLIEEYAEEYNLDPLPVYRTLEELYPNIDREKYPLLMNSGSRKPQFMHSRTYKMKWIRDLEPIDAVDINPEDAKKYGFTQGEKVSISTDKGSIDATINITVTVLPGVVHMYHGNVNADVDKLMDKDYLDPLSGFPGFKSFACRIDKK